MATVNLMAVSKSYEHRYILRDIHLRIEKGEFVAVVGPSGCGKSSLLRLIAGLDTVTEGKIHINDKCVNTMPAAARDMAMVFQNYALYPHMSVYDNMAYGLKMRRMKKHEIRQRVEEAAHLLQLGEYLHRKPGMLSGGQRQRVAMGRAMVRSPAVFLFDEPLSNLDAKLRAEMRHEIKKLHQQLNTTCIYVTHDQIEAMTMADRVVILNQGNIEQVGTPQTLYHYPASLFVAGFIGHYPMNFMQATLDKAQQQVVTSTGLHLPLPAGIAEKVLGTEVIVGIRPEHLLISETTGMPVNIEFVDDMGADKLVQTVSTLADVRLSIRVSADTTWTGSRLMLDMNISKASLFCKHTGQRLGGWGEAKQ